MQILKLGDTGVKIAELKLLLVKLGLLPENLDNLNAALKNISRANKIRFDHLTYNAIKTFQQQRGLIVDGIVGEQTYATLLGAGFKFGSRILYYKPNQELFGDDVASLQSRLHDLGYYYGIIDGKFSLTTYNALCNYQHEFGLTSDGICGFQTLQALGYLGLEINTGSFYNIQATESVRKLGSQLAGKKILIDPRITLEYPLAVSNNLLELQRNVLDNLLSNLEHKMLTARISTFITTQLIESLSDKTVAKFANNLDVDMAISIKLGLNTSTKPNGVAAFYYGLESGRKSNLGEKLAKAMVSEITARTSFLNCRFHPRSWDILKFTKMPTIQLDLGYLTNPKDKLMLSSAREINQVVEGILIAIKRFYLLNADTQATGSFSLAELLAVEKNYTN